jgi:hypothetical protein
VEKHLGYLGTQKDADEAFPSHVAFLTSNSKLEGRMGKAWVNL